MFELLLAGLSDRYHLVAPDYPGFGDPRSLRFCRTHSPVLDCANGY